MRIIFDKVNRQNLSYLTIKIKLCKNNANIKIQFLIILGSLKNTLENETAEVETIF